LLAVGAYAYAREGVISISEEYVGGIVRVATYEIARRGSENDKLTVRRYRWIEALPIWGCPSDTNRDLDGYRGNELRLGAHGEGEKTESKKREPLHTVPMTRRPPQCT
jgi:hypothetical protein